MSLDDEDARGSGPSDGAARESGQFKTGPVDTSVRMKRTISTDDAPDAVGAYSQATTNGDLLFTAGQIALTPEGDLMDDASVADQTEQALTNVGAILESEGLSMDDLLKTTVFLADIEDFDEMNETYAGFFDDEPPARSAVQAGGLPAGVDVEIEAVASLDD